VIALGAVGLNAGFDAIFYRLGIWGIPLATAAVNVVAAAVLLTAMRRRIGLEHVGRTLAVVGRIVLAGAVAAAAALAAWYGADAVLGRSLVAQVLSLGLAFVAGGALYVAAARALLVRELDELLSLRGR
jgi:peptidoglycan biosynthesis protein MviN/MurJ (putative lipid II flippase)